MASQGLSARFERAGWNQGQVENAVADAETAAVYASVLDEAGWDASYDVNAAGGDAAVLGGFLYDVATAWLKKPFTGRAEVAALVGSGEVETAKKLKLALKFCGKVKKGKKLDEAKLRKSCGAGVTVTEEDVRTAVRAVLRDNAKVVEEQGAKALKRLQGQVMKRLPFVEGAMLQRVMAEESGLGGGASSKKKSSKKGSSGPAAAAAAPEEGDDADLPDLGAGREVEWAKNTEEQMARHLAVTKGQIRTRFPPEPNGFLHLGHAKAIRFNFKVARDQGGTCNLRFDDTNPSAEKQVYIDNIIENVKWLGHTPDNVTYSSDVFDELYELAVKLIKQGDAYVDHLSKPEIEQYRLEHKPSPHRSRSVEENLRLFEGMRMGKFAEGECCLRMKGDLNHPMASMWDLVAYRIQYREHPHAGDKWCIYPSYDFTHCIVDSLENITHSLCTLEFESRRESYFWLLDRLDLYKPKVWEYSRLSVEYNVMSKRIIKRLVTDKYVSGWDDPRLLTLNGLRRRGYTADCINTFVAAAGVTRNANSQTVERLNSFSRDVLNPVARRVMVVQDPLPVTLVNVDDAFLEACSAPNFPNDPSRGSRTFHLAKRLFIERDDFREQDERGYHRLAPGKTVMLKYGRQIRCVGFEKDADGNVTHVRAEALLTTESRNNKPKVKGIIHWVADHPDHPTLEVEMRLYDKLFTHPDPASLSADDEWIKHLNPKSLVITSGRANRSELAGAVHEDNIQCERLGFFVVDADTDGDKIVLNRTIELRSGKGKSAEADAERRRRREAAKKARRG